ncbi:unnamed protein product, partial [marine sediment metagenome]
LLTWLKLVDITIAEPTTTGCVVTIATATDQTLSLYSGGSKTSMFKKTDGVWETDTTTFTIADLTPGLEYFFYVITTLGTGAERTGIYKFKTPAE